MIINIGTRGSKLALVQAEMVKKQILQFIKKIIAGQSKLKVNQDIYKDILNECKINIVKIKTTGDQLLEVSLKNMGGKGLFIKEIEEALLDDKIDLAVHSLKDMPALLPTNLELACFLKREDPSDVWISKNGKLLYNIEPKSRIGTCSSRRIAFIKEKRSDLDIIELRGNVDTRIAKMQNGIVDAIILAYAGLKRIKCTNIITEKMPLAGFIPAIGQGTIAIETKTLNYALKNANGDIYKEAKARFLIDMLYSMNDQKTKICSLVEREFLKTIGGDCSTPMAAYAYFKKNSKILYLDAMLEINDANKVFVNRVSLETKFTNIDKAIELGGEAAAKCKNLYK